MIYNILSFILQLNLAELLNNNFGADNSPIETFQEAPKVKGKSARIENKNFYFDVSRNQQGKYMMITEASDKYRNSILVPESGWDTFRDVFDSIAFKTQD